MVPVNLVIITLASMFFLNACGNSNLNRPANIDDQEAVLFKTGTVSGRATRVVEREYNENDELITKEVKPIFEEVSLEANFDTKNVIFKANVINDENKVETVTYEGEFDEIGFALLSPKNTKLKTKAVVRCVESCGKLIADVGIRHLVNGKLKYEAEQFELKDNKISRIETPDELTEPVKEIDPTASNLSDSKTPNVPVKKNEPQKEKAKIPIPKVDKVEEEEVLVEESNVEMVEPGIDTGKYQDFMDEKLLDDGQSLKSILEPYNLGDKYPGQAMGYYGKGSLKKGTDIMANIKNLANAGFVSVSRSDHIHYGSGLLIKMIEEMGVLFTNSFPGHRFEVNDTSKKAGGYVYPHESHQNGLDADILLPKLKNGKIDYAKSWLIVKSFYYKEKQIKSILKPDRAKEDGIMILSPVIMKDMCAYLKSSKEKDFSAPFAKLYKDVLSKKTTRNKRTKKKTVTYYYAHSNHMHMRVLCTPHNKSCHSGSYTKSKFGMCK